MKGKIVMNNEENIYSKLCINCNQMFIGKGKSPDLCPDCEKLYQNEYLGQWIVYQNDYIQIIGENLKGRKTPIYHIISRLSKDEIGQIKWYGAWRKYCFFPNGDTVWDKKCLDSVCDWLLEVNTPVEKRTAKGEGDIWK